MRVAETSAKPPGIISPAANTASTRHQACSFRHIVGKTVTSLCWSLRAPTNALRLPRYKSTAADHRGNGAGVHISSSVSVHKTA